jgi:opacity protein-like surface antigen
MKRILLAAVALAAVAVTAAPASAQVWVGSTPNYGAGVQVGPFGVGTGYYPYHHAYYNDYAYEPSCRLERERVVTARGHVIFRTRRICD